MGREIDLLMHYPRTKRDVKVRGAEKTAEDRMIARRFGKEFFDGDRRHGYGGFNYEPRFWQPVIPDLQAHFGLNCQSSVLDVGCAKGFMLFDMMTLIPGIKVRGIDISDYAIANAKHEVRDLVTVADARRLPFPDNAFDVVISINTVHNLDRDECAQALREIERVARLGSFVTVDAYRTDEEKARMLAWNLTALTILSVDEWIAFFKEIGFSGDYFWFIP